jgi:hypothetical protein
MVDQTGIHTRAGNGFLHYQAAKVGGFQVAQCATKGADSRAYRAQDYDIALFHHQFLPCCSADALHQIACSQYQPLW